VSASIPDANGVIHGCIRNNGDLRIIDTATQSCTSAQDPISWNAGGAAGSGGLLANLQGADLWNSDFRYQDFRGVNMSGATLNGNRSANGIPLSHFGHNDLTGANLSNVSFYEAFISGQDFTTAASIIGMSLVGTSVDTSDFHGKDLRSLDLKGVQFDTSNLSGVNLSGWAIDCPVGGQMTRLYNSNVSGANLSNADNTPLLTCNPNAVPDFRLSNFTGANFTGAKLAHTNFGDSNLTNANFTNADLTAAILSGTTVTGVTWSNTTCPDGTNSDDNGETCVGHLVP
jgi:uncharacterized protein YjbI with pentapeptide repeats